MPVRVEDLGLERGDGLAQRGLGEILIAVRAVLALDVVEDPSNGGSSCSLGATTPSTTSPYIATNRR